MILGFDYGENVESTHHISHGMAPSDKTTTAMVSASFMDQNGLGS
jgi:hypothetical protein